MDNNICQADIIGKFENNDGVKQKIRHGHNLLPREANNDATIHIVGDNTDGALEGNSVALHCIVDGENVHYVTWTHGSAVLSNETQVLVDNSRIHVMRSSNPPVRTYTLIIDRLESSDAGSYRCFVYYGDPITQTFAESSLRLILKDTTPAITFFTGKTSTVIPATLSHTPLDAPTISLADLAPNSPPINPTSNAAEIDVSTLSTGKTSTVIPAT